jgi:hypothetical protein
VDGHPAELIGPDYAEPSESVVAVRQWKRRGLGITRRSG